MTPWQPPRYLSLRTTRSPVLLHLSVIYMPGLPPNTWLPRLTLAVVLGRLQSLVDATSQHIGQAYLRTLYHDLHSLEHRRPDGYDKIVTLCDNSWSDLVWWEHYLSRNPGARSHTGSSATQVTTWGDGSGTGTGGTFEKQGANGTLPTMDLWMGTWNPQVHHFSSNWQEMRTLVQTLERERGRNRVTNHTMFYFTDNLVMYYVIQGGSSASPELHKLALHTKLLELELGCHLEVIHVPGTLMIRQGTDGLS
jgi:hypothetical protein